MKAKLFTLFLALVASAGTIFAWDYEYVQIGDLYYNLDAANQTAEVTSQLSWSDNYSGLTAATIPASVTYNSVSYSVTSIGNYAFEDCTGLTSVTIPNSVTSIGNYAFEDCTGLTSVTIPNSVTSIGYGAFYGCSGLTSVTIPNSVTSIGYDTFYGCSSLTSVTIPNSVTSIGEGAFCYCTGLTSITIPNSVISIGERAFSSCSSLTSITIPNSVISIGERAFSSCSSLTSIVVENENMIYDSRNNCNAIINTATNTLIAGSKNTIIPNSVTSIGEGAFCYCTGLTSITIPNSVTSIGNDAFEGCTGLTSVTIPNSVTSIGEWAFYGCSSLTSIEIPNSVTSIGDRAFRGCTGLTSVTIGNSVTSIGEYAFYGCSGLTSVTLGTSVKVIEERAFDGCTAIETITCYSMRPPTVNQDALYGLDYSTIVYVPADYLETYKMHDAWGLYDVRPLGAKSTETTDVNVTPAENTAEVAWPAVSGAATYELVIKDKSGNVICTLIFNAQGQLTQIAFNAPSRNNAPQQTQAAGFSFTVTGLEEGTSYDLTITSKDNNGTTLDTKTVAFTTTGESPQGIDNTPFPSGEGRGEASKILHNGQILILRGDKTYTLQGQEVK